MRAGFGADAGGFTAGFGADCRRLAPDLALTDRFSGFPAVTPGLTLGAVTTV